MTLTCLLAAFANFLVARPLGLKPALAMTANNLAMGVKSNNTSYI